MRTTLDIDDTALAAARALALDEGISIGAALSRLALKGLRTVSPSLGAGRFPTFEVDPDARLITLDMVNAARDED